MYEPQLTSDVDIMLRVTLRSVHHPRFCTAAMYVLDFGVSYRHVVLILDYICPELLSSIAYSSARVVILQFNV
jgi:hypothetical protein